MGGRGVRIWCSVAFWTVALAVGLGAQTPVPRILEQDSTLDNLSTPPGAETAPLGSLGSELRRGTGPTTLLMIPGLGFGAEVFESLMAELEDTHTMWAVTLPGMAGTSAPATPPPGTSFGAQTWTDGAYRGIEALMQREGLEDVVVVGHWLTGTQLALRLAAEHPERVRAVVLISGSARFAQPGLDERTHEERVASVDRGLAPQWFRTVTRETWDDNNFLPGDYAAHPVLGLRLWREAARPPLHVWVRYLCEYHAHDTAAHLSRVSAPILRLDPGLEGLWFDPANPYMENYTRASWGGLAAPTMRTREIPGTRAVPWADAPERVAAEIVDFLARVEGA